MNILKLLLVLALLLSVSGCADIAPPTPEDIIKRPLGTDSVKIGMTKGRVKENDIIWQKKGASWRRSESPVYPWKPHFFERHFH